jgi:hypothetical protein
VKQGETWQEMSINLADNVLCHAAQGSLTCCKILQHGADGFPSPLKEVMIWILIALENASSSVGCETVNLGSSGKDSNH